MNIYRNCRNATLALLTTVVALCAAPALASFHLFVIDELYSTADGTVQYIVLRESAGANGENLLGGIQLVSSSGTVVKTFTFPANLPSSQTANRKVLIGTQGFAALGLVAPDYTVPDRFLPTQGGTLNYGGVDIVTFPPLPTDGTNAFFRGGGVAANSATNFAGATASVPAGPVTVVEFYNATLDHYFISPLSPDIDALDSGRLPGWARTGFSFFANPAPGAGLNPVCRFYIPPQHGDSHFFTASADECAAVNGKIPVDPNYSGYSFETPNAFYIALPDVTTGACPANTQPVYRLWNQRADSNHRYTTNPGVRSDMLARGYVGEGYGPDSVIMCAPAMAIADKTTRVTAASPLAPGCDGVAPTGFLYTGSEVEPFVAINPRDPNNLIGVWQQDRWSNGGAAALATGVSRDGGQTWARNTVPFSRCTGGNAGNGGDYARASDPWVTISPDGTAYQIALALNGASFTANSSNAVLVSRSADGGSTWTNPVTLIQDGVAFFNDKESITADSTDSRFVYAIWDRLVQNNGGGPTWLARTVNGGQSWNPPVPIYDPGMNSQTINNQIVVLPNGTLVNFFTQLDNDGTNVTAARLSVIRSADKGVTWSAPIPVALVQSVGTTDPASGVRVRDGSTLGAIAVGKKRLARRCVAGRALLRRRARRDCAVAFARWRIDVVGAGAHQRRAGGVGLRARRCDPRRRRDRRQLLRLPQQHRGPGDAAYRLLADAVDRWRRVDRASRGGAVRSCSGAGRQRAVRRRLPGPCRSGLDVLFVLRDHQRRRRRQPHRRLRDDRVQPQARRGPRHRDDALRRLRAAAADDRRAARTPCRQLHARHRHPHAELAPPAAAAPPLTHPPRFTATSSPLSQVLRQRHPQHPAFVRITELPAQRPPQPPVFAPRPRQ
jgi:hypothetical protein